MTPKLIPMIPKSIQLIPMKRLFIQNDSSVTQKNIGKKLGISIATVKRIMRSLQKSDRIQREDSRRNSLWTVINFEGVK